MADYIPEPDPEFNTWQQNFINYAEEHLAELGLTVEQFTQLDALGAAWTLSYTNHVAAQDAAHAATEAKDIDRVALVADFRELAGLIQANPAVTDPTREAIGLHVHKTGRTPAPVPTSRPVVEVDNSQRLRHIVSFRDEGALNRAKPAGVAGCEIWLKVGGEPPKSVGELRLLGIDTRTPYLWDFDGSEGGQIAYYWLRWVNTRNQPGPWSEPASATIAA